MGALIYFTTRCSTRTYISTAAPVPASLPPRPHLHLHPRAYAYTSTHRAMMLIAVPMLGSSPPQDFFSVPAHCYHHSPAFPPQPCSSSRVATPKNSLAGSAFPLYPCRDLVVPHCAQYTHLFIGVFLGSKTFFYLLPNCLLQ